jgi:phenylacetate-coenzyme A ligase PaaK-like adenylate-forming protein
VADYETLRQRHVARFGEVVPEMFERMTWPAERLRAGRERRLRALVAHARARSPWHGRRLAGLDPERLRETELRDLPVMTKNDLMEHFDEVVTDPRLTRDVVEAHLATLSNDAYLLDEYHVCASGGSSGRRGAFVYDFDGWVIAWGGLIRFIARRNAEVFGHDGAPPVIALIAADKASHMTAAFSQTFRVPGLPIHRLPATWPLARIVATLNEIQPDSLQGYASVVHLLTGEAAAGRLRIAPRMVGTTSEPLLPEIREAIAATWGVPLFNALGTTEGLMGGSCSAGRGIHLNDDVCIVEPVDAAGQPVPAGERAAKVYLTNLYNLTTPLIRYELTDEVTVLDEPCPCGMTLMRIDDIQGRLDDCFTYPGGPTIHPFTFRSPLGRERNIVEYQVCQTTRGADVLVRCQGPIDTTRIAETIRGALADAGLSGAEVSVTRVDALDRQSTTGKFRRFVPLAGAA